MLKSLSIRNYAIIEHTEVSFQGGFSVITGETGAGKSILLEAIAMVLGSRANTKAIRRGTEKCVVEIAFVTEDPIVEEMLLHHGLDSLDELILRRELTASGRSRSFINDSPVNLPVVKAFGLRLVDLHGQQENISLQSSTYQTKQLDLFADNKELMASYTEAFKEFKQAQRDVTRLEELAIQVKKDADYFQFQFDELNAIQFTEEEAQQLENDFNELEHANEIIQSVSNAIGVLDDEQSGVLSALRQALSEVSKVEGFSESIKQIAERIKSAAIEIEDIVTESERVRDHIDADPQRLIFLQEQLDELNRLLHKHHVQNVAELYSVKADYQERLDGITSVNDELAAAQKALETAQARLKQLAKQLFDRRQKSIPLFENEIMHQLHELGMPKATISVALSANEGFGPTGTESVDLLFNANSDKQLTPLREVASGGEVSRLMLAIKSILASRDEMPSLLFDEIDTGVSGEVAKKIGKLMQSIGQEMQLIAVTHLPGVAAKGQHHVKIAKVEEQGEMVSKLIELNEQERVREIASMFSGEDLSEASLESARNLLEE